MLDKLRQLLRIHRGEGWKVFHFALLGALLQAGLAIGISTSDSLFIAHVGAKYLPILYMLMPVAMLGFTGLYTVLAGRVKIEHVLFAGLFLVMIGSVALYDYFKLEGHPVRVVYFVAKIFSGIWFIGLYTFFWNFADEYFDIQDAKRLYPLLSGGGATGAMIGGALVQVMSTRVEVAFLYLAWLGTALIALLVAWLLVIRWKKIESDRDDEQIGVFKQVADTFGAIARSGYVRAFLAVLFLGVVLNTINEFQYSQIFQFKGLSQYAGDFTQPRSDKEVAQLFGALFMWVNLFNLVVNFLFFNRLVARIGVGNVAMIAPVTYIVTFLVLLLGYGKAAGIVGFVAYQGIITSIDWNNANFLFNAVPSAVKTQVRTIAEGFIEPLATAAVGAFLFFFTRGWLPDRISATGLTVAALFFVIALVLRGNYLGAMVANLKNEWLDFSQSESRILSGLNAEEQTLLKGRACSRDLRIAQSAIKVMWLNDRESAAECLLQVMSRGPIELRESVPLLSMMLEDEDSEIIRRVLDWLDRIHLTLTPALLEELGDHGLIHTPDVSHLYGSSDPNEQAAAVVASWDSWNTEDRLTAMMTVTGLLHGNAEQVAAGIRALGRSKHERHAHYLLPFLTDDDPNVRHEALTAVYRLATPESGRIVPNLLDAIEDGGTADREVGMDAIAKIGGTESIAPLLELSPRFSPYERRKAELVLRDIGLKSVPATVAVVRDQRAPYMARSISARALAQLSFAQLEAISPEIIVTEIKRSYEFLYSHRVLRDAIAAATQGQRLIGLSVLSRFYVDTQSTVLDFVLELLSVGGRLPDFELISASLRSSNRRDRGNAIEAIEQGVDRAVFKILLPLIDDSVESGDVLRTMMSRLSIRTRTVNKIVEGGLNSSSPIVAAAAAQAMIELEIPAAGDALRALMRESTNPLVRETIVALLAGNEAAGLNIVERLELLGRTDYFGKVHMRDLLPIALLGAEVRAEAGHQLYERGEAPDTVYVVVDGHVSVGGEVRSAPSVFGLEGVRGMSFRSSNAGVNPAMGARLLHIATAELLHTASTYPHIALTLLAHALNVFDAAEEGVAA